MARESTKAWRRLPLAERKAIKAHEALLRQLPCVVTGRTPVTLHHCHGGSMKEAGFHVGMGEKASDWLQIPIHADLHVGPMGIDGGFGVKAWEELNGRQIDHLGAVSKKLGYNVIERAKRGI